MPALKDPELPRSEEDRRGKPVEPQEEVNLEESHLEPKLDQLSEKVREQVKRVFKNKPMNTLGELRKRSGLAASPQFMKIAETEAKRIYRQDFAKTMATIYACGKRGTMLESMVVDHVLEEVINNLRERGNGWTILLEKQLRANLVHGDQEIEGLIRANSKFSTILNLPGRLHFVHLEYDGSHISIRDNLFDFSEVKEDGTMERMSPDLTRLVGRFKHLLKTCEKNVSDDIYFQPCARQLDNSMDCAIESIVSLLKRVYGVTDRAKIAFCREMIQDAQQHYKEGNADPYQGFEFIHTLPCCDQAASDQVQENWCAEHHPFMRGCRSRLVKCKDCAEPAVNLCGIDDCCWQHATTVQRDHIRTRIVERGVPPAQPAHKTPHEKLSSKLQEGARTRRVVTKKALAPPTKSKESKTTKNHESLRGFLRIFFFGTDSGTARSGWSESYVCWVRFERGKRQVQRSKLSLQKGQAKRRVARATSLSNWWRSRTTSKEASRASPKYSTVSARGAQRGTSARMMMITSSSCPTQATVTTGGPSASRQKVKSWSS